METTMSELCPLIFMDTETTGLNPEEHELIEIALKRLDPKTLEVMGSYHVLVLPSVPPTPEVAAINGYDETKWKAQGAKPNLETEDFEKMEALLQGATPAGQNPSFDMSFLRAAWAAVFEHGSLQVPFPKMDYHQLDLAALAWPLYVAGVLPGLSLRHTRKLFGLPGEQEHRAMADVDDSIAVYKAMLKLYAPAVASLSGEAARVELRPNPVAQTQLHRLARALNKTGEHIIEEAVGLLALSVDAVNEGRGLAIVDSDGVMVSRVKLELGSRKG
jgi:DNA polymerase-3 subunit epsilon